MKINVVSSACSFAKLPAIDMRISSNKLGLTRERFAQWISFVKEREGSIITTIAISKFDIQIRILLIP